ncbi:hypothetical protein Cni_G08180 [Canna indica]|uniref:Uncharacterized protein n=1 Tax=Canna indica TaxID=4628 RepID=A0AAQ3K041_9LILI|nr:hypothetical protein Cni_G08180 [Canna indica]
MRSHTREGERRGCPDHGRGPDAETGSGEGERRVSTQTAIRRDEIERGREACVDVDDQTPRQDRERARGEATRTQTSRRRDGIGRGREACVDADDQTPRRDRERARGEATRRQCVREVRESKRWVSVMGQ